MTQVKQERLNALIGLIREAGIQANRSSFVADDDDLEALPLPRQRRKIG